MKIQLTESNISPEPHIYTDILAVIDYAFSPKKRSKRHIQKTGVLLDVCCQY